MTVATDYQVELKRKDARIAELEDENIKLKMAGGINPNLVMRFRIPYSQAKILEILSSGRLYSIEQLAEWICKEDTRPSSITVRMVALRKAIAPLEIRTVWGQGYCRAGEHLEAVRAIMRGE